MMLREAASAKVIFEWLVFGIGSIAFGMLVKIMGHELRRYFKCYQSWKFVAA
ncbi:hypothetical protein PS941_01101 [Pseudomonas fluorescens]|uniref:Uncharacterized protein n=1 Tax=Pseudomonas fluorescens TaxID=294 RepID=A0A5E7SFV3_PSEFL|nr:hypothetical protein PS941_01101 [Pseudomonas fluorescens]